MTSYVQENVPPFSSFSHQIFSFQRAMFSSKKNYFDFYQSNITEVDKILTTGTALFSKELSDGN